MNHGSNNNNNNSNNVNGNNQRNNWRSRGSRYNRYPNNAKSNNVQPSMRSPMKNQLTDMSSMIEAFACSTDLVNSIKQGIFRVKHADRISPTDSPVGEYNNASPIRHRQSNAGIESTATIWEMDLGDWSPRKVADLPYPKCIPTLNGSPHAGGPATLDPSPVGSSRCSTYSNPSPPQVISGDSSPRMADYFPMNGGRRSSDELYLELQEIHRASNSQSPEEPNNCRGFKPIGFHRNRVDSRLSDDVNYPGYYPTCKSSDSRSSEDLSLENIVGELGTLSPELAAGDAKRLSNASGSPKCNQCTMDRVCDSCQEIYTTTLLANAIERVESNQDTPFTREISSAMAVLDLASYNQKIPRTNTLPPILENLVDCIY